MLNEHRPVEAQLAGLREGDRGDGQDGDEHGKAAEDGVDQELEGGVDALALTPDPDQEVEGNQHRLPEDIEEDEVERQQDAGSGGLEDQQQQDELLQPRGGRAGYQDGDQKQQCVQSEEEEAQPIDSEVVADADRRHPLTEFLELKMKIADALLEPADDHQHQRKGDHGSENAELLDDASGHRRRERNQKRTGQWDDDGQRQPGDVGGERVPAHQPSLTGREPRNAATTSTTPMAPPSVHRA